MTRITEINSLADLAGYRLLWNSLLPNTRGAGFFQSFDWLETYWRHQGEQQQMRVLVVSVDDRPIGILPLVVVPEATRLGTVRVLTYPLDGWGSFYGPIGPHPTATLWAGLRHIQETPRDWDLVDLRFVDADGVDAGRTAQALRGVGLSGPQQPFMQSAQIDMTEGWAAYWQSRKPHWRQNVERSERRLAEQGEITHIRFRPEGNRCDDGDPRWDLYDACESLACKSWQGSATDGTTLSHAEVRDYLRDAHETAAAAGGLDLNLLLVGGRPAAFAYNYHYRGSVYGVRAGFDPQVSTQGAGTVLFRRMIEDSFARGDHLFDLGPGSLEAKRYWQTRVRTCYHYPHYAATNVKAQALRMRRWLVGAK